MTAQEAAVVGSTPTERKRRARDRSAQGPVLAGKTRPTALLTPPTSTNNPRLRSSPLSFEARLHHRHVNAAARLIARFGFEHEDRGSTGQETDEIEAAEAQVRQSLVVEPHDFAGVYTSAAFFASLARHSRLRPDLIAADLDLDEYAVRIQLASFARAAQPLYAKARKANKGYGIEAHPAAREVSAAFLTREEAWADELLSEDRACMEPDKHQNRGLVRLLQADALPDGDIDGNANTGDHAEAGDIDPILLRLGSNADAFDMAQHRSAAEGMLPRASSAPSSPTSVSRLSLSNVDAERDLSPKKAEKKAREEDEETTFEELSAIPKRLRTEDERSILTALRSRLRSRKRKRAEASTRRRAPPIAPIDTATSPRAAVLLLTDNGDQVSLPAEGSSAASQPEPPPKRRKTHAEKQAAYELRLTDLKAIGRKNLSPEQIAEYEKLLKRITARERRRREVAQRRSASGIEWSAHAVNDLGADEEDSTVVGATADDPEGVHDAATSRRAMSQRLQSDAGLKEEKPDILLPEQEEDLFNVGYFRGAPQNSELPSLLKSHLCAFLNPIIRRAIVYAEALAPTHALIERRKRARDAAKMRDPADRKRGRPKKVGDYPTRSSSTRARTYGNTHEYSASNGEAWWEDPEDTAFNLNADEEAGSAARRPGVTLGNVLMALEAPTARTFDEMLGSDLHGSAAGIESIDELKVLSHAHELLDLDNNSDGSDDTDDSDDNENDEETEFESEEGDEHAAGTEQDEAADQSQSGKNGLHDTIDARSWRDYSLEADLDEKLDAVDTAFDRLAERDLDAAFASAQATMNRSKNASSRRRQSTSSGDPEDQEGEPSGVTQIMRPPLMDWNDILGAKYGRKVKNVIKTGDFHTDALVKGQRNRDCTSTNATLSWRG